MSEAPLPLEARGRLTDREHLDALRVVGRRMGRGWIVPAVFLGGPALLVGASLLGGTSLAHAVLQNLFWIILGPLLFVGLPLGNRLGLRRFLRSNPEFGVDQLYRFTDHGLEVRGGPREITIAWPAMVEALETKSAFFLFTGPTMAEIVPRGPFVAAGRLEAVREVLRERLGARARLLAGGADAP